MPNKDKIVEELLSMNSPPSLRLNETAIPDEIEKLLGELAYVSATFVDASDRERRLKLKLDERRQEFAEELRSQQEKKVSEAEIDRRICTDPKWRALMEELFKVKRELDQANIKREAIRHRKDFLTLLVHFRKMELELCQTK